MKYECWMIKTYSRVASYISSTPVCCRRADKLEQLLQEKVKGNHLYSG